MYILNAALYYLIILPISLLPFRILYLFSDFLFFWLYRVAGYRTKVVSQNLKNALPDKTPEELKKIEFEFYHHLCDVIVESLKSFTISSEQVLKRMIYTNPEVINRFSDAGQSVLIAGGHYNNWEWTAISSQQQLKHKMLAVYTPLSNKYFDQKMLSTRSKYGLRLISFKEITNFYATHQHLCTATIFGIDQSPRNPNKCYWTTFLNQDTGVQFGVEKFARDYNYPVIFARITKIKRGYYSIHLAVASEHPREEPHGNIIETTTRLLEEQILEKPQFWLWTHRRWKHKRPIDSKQGHG